jgi:hypothetical protein
MYKLNRVKKIYFDPKNILFFLAKKYTFQEKKSIFFWDITPPPQKKKIEPKNA